MIAIASNKAAGKGAVWTVYYRCLYREYWYEEADCDTWDQVLEAVRRLERQGRMARVTSPQGIIYQTGYA